MRGPNMYEPTWVYRLRCGHGGLLYVGIARDLQARLYQHSRTKPWWPDVASVLAYQFPTRSEAREAELAAITLDMPAHNIAGVIPNAQYAANRWAQTFETSRLPVFTAHYGQDIA